MNSRYTSAKQIFAQFGIDTDLAISTLSRVPVSMHCWQGDDVKGFEGAGSISGGIQTTGNYPGAARTPAELMQDIRFALSQIPGKKRLNLHASYAIFEEGQKVDRDRILPCHFKAWVDFAKENGLGLDFNPTFFAHPLAADNLTLSSPDEEKRAFWVRHGIACLRIAEYFANELNTYCLVNFWIPDGYKDTPANRLKPRARFMKSMDEILGCGYDKEKVLVSLESKVFGIGLESYTVGSAEFGMQYASSRGILCLMDNGHYHPTEVVSDKLSSMLLFNDRVALHLTRGVRWDSDHVIRLDDELKEICKEIVAADALDRVLIATDFFDASINRIAAWVIGLRNVQKGLLTALLTPHKMLTRLQDEGRFTELLALSEALKNLPYEDVWNAYLEQQNVPDSFTWIQNVMNYEKTELNGRKD